MLSSYLLTVKAQITKCRMLLSSAELFEASSTNSVVPDQTASIGADCSGSTLFDSIPMLTNKQTLWRMMIELPSSHFQL